MKSSAATKQLIEVNNLDLIKLTQENMDQFCPDDSGRSWKHPWKWTPNEIHNLVMEEVGIDETFARGFQVLIKLWMPNRTDDLGLENSDHYMRDEMHKCTIGKILRMGKECYADRVRFPFGPRFTYGEWAVFRGTERQKLQKNGHMMAFVNEDRFMGSDDNPKTLQTSFDLEHEWADH